MKIVLMENEQEIWKIKARKEAYMIFPINIIAGIIKFFLGIRVPGELVFTNKRIIFVYKKISLCCIVKEEMLEYTMLSRLTSVSAGVKNAFLCLIKRDCITINGTDEYFSKGMKADEIQSNITRVMATIEK
tara:strand:- start:5193 stop:5585 length:393 start_codon:yes stop_codon:yes gene_type:complete